MRTKLKLVSAIGALVLAGEPHQDVAADVKVLPQPLASPAADPGKIVGRIAAAHSAQDPVVPALERKVQVRAEDGALPQGLQEVVRECEGLQGPQAKPLQPRQGRECAHQLRPYMPRWIPVRTISLHPASRRRRASSIVRSAGRLTERPRRNGMTQ